MKYLRKFLTTLLLLCTTVATAHEFEVNGIFYNITDETNKTVAVTYKGNSYDDYSNEYTGSVVIPENVTYNGNTYSVTSIGGSAFRGCTGLTSVTIGNSVTSIGEEAFYYCSGLTSVTIPNSVTSIGEGAFYNTGWYNNQPDGILKLSKWVIGYKGTAPSGELNINKKEIGIADGAFKNCSDLTAVSIGNNIKSIGSSAFRDCTGLTSVTIGNSVTSIGDDAFSGCTGLKEVHISDLSAWCNIKFDDSTANPLYYAHNLYLNGKLVTDLVIPDGISEIKNYAFRGCSGLTSVTIGNSVTSIGGSAFYGCSGLTSVYISDLSAWCNIGFDGASANPLYYAKNLYLNGELLTNLIIPDGVTKIKNYAFEDCVGLTSVTIPNSVTSIGAYAFRDCSGLTSVTIPNSVTSIGYDAFYDCTSLTSVTIPNSVTSIEDGAFDGCSGLTSVTIGNSVTSIGKRAFQGCSGLTSITIPNSVTSIGWVAFWGCTGLKTIINLSNLTLSKGSSGYGYVAYYAKRVINAPNVAVVGDFVFSTVDGKHTLGAYLGDSMDVTLPGNYNGENYVIGNSAFEGCSGLTSITIPNSVTSIGKYAFYGCSGLKEIYVKSKTPIELNYDPFGSAIYDTTALIVPLGSKENYRTSDYWKNFKNIAEFDYDKEVLYKEFSDWTSTNTDNSTTSSNRYTFKAVVGGKLSFDWEVSSEEEYDWFIVTLNGAEIVKESGEKSGSYEYTFTENGTYTLVVEYTKDDEYSEGGNYGKIYNIQLWLPLTDVEEIQTDDSFQGTKNVYYDLYGRKVENPTSGIYIINGKKVFVK